MPEPVAAVNCSANVAEPPSSSPVNSWNLLLSQNLIHQSLVTVITPPATSTDSLEPAKTTPPRYPSRERRQPQHAHMTPFRSEECRNADINMNNQQTIYCWCDCVPCSLVGCLPCAANPSCLLYFDRQCVLCGDSLFMPCSVLYVSPDFRLC